MNSKERIRTELDAKVAALFADAVEYYPGDVVIAAHAKGLTVEEYLNWKKEKKNG